jgi:hypothetical protein
MDVSLLTAGLYMFTIRSSSSSTTIKFIKE